MYPMYHRWMTESRLREPSFLVLSALAQGPSHGYGIISDVESQSGGSVVLRVGTLYGALDRLTEQKLIEFDHEEVVNSRLRRYYRLSAAGRIRLGKEAERARDQAETALLRLGAGTAKPTRVRAVTT